MTDEEKVELLEALVEALVVDAIAVDFVAWEKFPPEFERDVMALVLREKRARGEIEKKLRFERDKAQCRAMALLRSFLTARQRKSLRERRYFYVVGSAGGVYRLRPEVGLCEGVELHGSRYFRKTTFCFHDPDLIMPPADDSLGQMLLILADEPDFLARANAKTIEHQLWNGDYVRRMRAARRAREQEGAAA